MYIKFSPSEYVIRYKRGKAIQKGKGLSFFYLDRNTSACAIPTSYIDADFIFNVQTEDFQTVSVQGQAAYVIADYEKIADSMDFTVSLKNKQYTNNPIPKLSKRIVNLIEVFVKDSVRRYALTDAVQSSQIIAGEISDHIQNEEELCRLGIRITGLSILKIAANADTTRALEAKTREEILKQADDALYERRNASIDQERKVKENELNTEISIEAKKKAIREAEIATKRMVLEKESELEKIKIENEVLLETKRKELAQLKLENSKKVSEAEAYRITVVMDAYNKLSPEVLVALANLNMDPNKMIAQAFQQLAAGSEKIGQLNITPDLLESVMESRTK